jgi:hypothetical protein
MSSQGHSHVLGSGVTDRSSNVDAAQRPNAATLHGLTRDLFPQQHVGYGGDGAPVISNEEIELIRSMPPAPVPMRNPFSTARPPLAGARARGGGAGSAAFALSYTRQFGGTNGTSGRAALSGPGAFSAPLGPAASSRAGYPLPAARFASASAGRSTSATETRGADAGTQASLLLDASTSPPPFATPLAEISARAGALGGLGGTALGNGASSRSVRFADASINTAGDTVECGRSHLDADSIVRDYDECIAAFTKRRLDAEVDAAASAAAVATSYEAGLIGVSCRREELKQRTQRLTSTLNLIYGASLVAGAAAEPALLTSSSQPLGQFVDPSASHVAALSHLMRTLVAAEGAQQPAQFGASKSNNVLSGAFLVADDARHRALLRAIVDAGGPGDSVSGALPAETTFSTRPMLEQLFHSQQHMVNAGPV